MRVVILAGGMGTRLSEETDSRPKPMVEVGGRPVLWHIMKGYAHHGFKDFLVALGYKGDVIKRFFAEYRQLSGSLRVDLRSGVVEHLEPSAEDWTIELVDTGLHTNTGGRVKRLSSLLQETFLLTYGDGVSNVSVPDLVRFHRAHGRLATVTAVRPPARFGGIVLDGDRVAHFAEKPQLGEGWISGGFFVLEPAVLDYFDGDDANLEIDGLERLAREGQLMAYRHEQFWQCMDTLRDVRLLERLWQSGNPPWKVWDR